MKKLGPGDNRMNSQNLNKLLNSYASYAAKIYEVGDYLGYNMK